MLEIASQIILCLLLAALIGFIIGYLLGKSTCADDSCHSAHDVSHDHADTHIASTHGEGDTTEPQGIVNSVTSSAKPESKSVQRSNTGTADSNTQPSHKEALPDTDDTAAATEIQGIIASTSTPKQDKSTSEQHSSSKTSDTSANTHTNDTEATDNTVNNKPEPLLLSGPRDGVKDNLTRIKGIGVKIEEALNGIGIYHFDQIAGWSNENITWADTNLGFPGRAEREQWVVQAKALSLGKETEFSKRVDAGKVSSSKQS